MLCHLWLPKFLNWAEDFVNTYVEICSVINVGLAPNCPNLEKAFLNSKTGKVLGINFNCETLSWNYPKEKREKAVNAILQCKNSEKVTVLQMQKLLGILNDVSIMCPFLKCFKFTLFQCLGQAIRNECDVMLSDVAKDDLRVWYNFMKDNVDIPICHEYSAKPLSYTSFTSDAAGSSASSIQRIGCGNIGFDTQGVIVFAYQIFWPLGILEKVKDVKNSALGNKTTTLEFLGILIPFLVIPEQLKNQHIEVKVDNTGCFFGWLNKKASCDVMASILIRALHVISYYLECIIHIEHRPRKSNWDALVTDRLSREKTTTRQDRKLLNSFDLPAIPLVLEQWMDSPTEDWSLPMKLLNYVKDKC